MSEDMPTAEVVKQAKERAELLRATGDLYAEIATFFEGLSERRCAVHEVKPTNLTMIASRTAFDLRGDYRRLSKECSEDAEIYDRLCAATLARTGEA